MTWGVYKIFLSNSSVSNMDMIWNSMVNGYYTKKLPFLEMKYKSNFINQTLFIWNLDRPS